MWAEVRRGKLVWETISWSYCFASGNSAMGIALNTIFLEPCRIKHLSISVILLFSSELMAAFSAAKQNWLLEQLCNSLRKQESKRKWQQTQLAKCWSWKSPAGLFLHYIYCKPLPLLSSAQVQYCQRELFTCTSLHHINLSQSINTCYLTTWPSFWISGSCSPYFYINIILMLMSYNMHICKFI